MHALQEWSHASVIFTPEVVRDCSAGRSQFNRRYSLEGLVDIIHDSATDGGSAVAAGILEPSNDGALMEDPRLLLRLDEGG